jgi:hypothetical protein
MDIQENYHKHTSGVNENIEEVGTARINRRLVALKKQDADHG